LYYDFHINGFSNQEYVDSSSHISIHRSLIAPVMQQLGLQTPEVVRQSTSDYRGEMDLLAVFIEDCCLTGEKYQALARYLYQAFTRWCGENGERVWTQRTFGLRLRERGFEKTKRMQGILWLSIGLTSTPETDLK
jgi:putative DNA primase/helicase